VGMSTVPEVIAARHLGVRVAALSCITNMACGMEAGEVRYCVGCVGWLDGVLVGNGWDSHWQDLRNCSHGGQ